jgi:hypothetical protein
MTNGVFAVIARSPELVERATNLNKLDFCNWLTRLFYKYYSIHVNCRIIHLQENEHAYH